jgi:hypothetical protein
VWGSLERNVGCAVDAEGVRERSGLEGTEAKAVP